MKTTFVLILLAVLSALSANSFAVTPEPKVKEKSIEGEKLDRDTEAASANVMECNGNCTGAIHQNPLTEERVRDRNRISDVLGVPGSPKETPTTNGRAVKGG